MNYYNSEPYKSIFDSKFYIPQSSLSATTSIQTANQLAEVNARLNAGVYGVDLSIINPEVFESIPKQHFKEMQSLAKLSGATVSMHGPIVDLAGFSQNRYDKDLRKQVEIQMDYFVERAHDLNPEGNTPINFHVNTAVPGEIWKKISDEEKKEIESIESKSSERALTDEEAKRLKNNEIKEGVGIVNQDTGELSFVKFDIRSTVNGKTIYTPDSRLRLQNETLWDQEKLRIFELQKQREEREAMFDHAFSKLKDLKKMDEQGFIGKDDPERREMESLKHSVDLMGKHIHEIDKHVDTMLNEMYHKSQKYADPEEVKESSSKLKGELKEIKSYHDEMERLSKAYKTASEEGNERKAAEAIALLRRQNEQKRDEIRKVFTTYVEQLPTPQIYVPTNKIALDKTAETLANTAATAFSKFGEHTPLITLENYQQDLTLGSAQDLKETVIKSRELFAQKLMNERKMKKDEAKRVAEKTIGVTWDVGHINFMRRKGYSEEEILAETKKIAPYVKQVHITDNFGFSDAHLPPGMGNVPMDKHIDILKKQGFKLDQGKLIVEAGNFVANFKENPHLYTLEAFNSPLYTLKADPSWYSVKDTYGTYGMGIGSIYPDLHFRDLYGSGFATLPRELGGQFPGEKSRFAGTPTA